MFVNSRVKDSSRMKKWNIKIKCVWSQITMAHIKNKYKEGSDQTSMLVNDSNIGHSCRNNYIKVDGSSTQMTFCQTNATYAGINDLIILSHSRVMSVMIRDGSV